jgi:hypothetical protein
MVVDGGKSSRTCKAMVFHIWNMEVGLCISIQLCKTKIDEADLQLILASAY